MENIKYLVFHCNKTELKNKNTPLNMNWNSLYGNYSKSQVSRKLRMQIYQ